MRQADILCYPEFTKNNTYQSSCGALPGPDDVDDSGTYRCGYPAARTAPGTLLSPSGRAVRAHRPHR